LARRIGPRAWNVQVGEREIERSRERGGVRSGVKGGLKEAGGDGSIKEYRPRDLSHPM